MRITLKTVGLVLFILCIGAVIQFVRLHDFGSRPQALIDNQHLNAGVTFTEANSLRFGYIEKGEGPLVLLLHGFPETARSWKQVQNHLSAKGYRTVAVFMRGYAPTALAPNYSVRSMGEDVVALIKALGEEQATIVGHDWGASAAYEAAFVAPDTISNLVTISIPHPRGTQPSMALLRRAPHFVYYQLPSADRLVWSHDFSHIRRIFKAWSPEFDMPEEDFVDIRKTMEVPGVIEATLGYYHALIANGKDNAELTATDDIVVPTLVMVGDADGAVGLDGFRDAESAFTGPYAFERLDGVGHFPQIEAPKRVADLIADFISNH